MMYSCTGISHRMDLQPTALFAANDYFYVLPANITEIVTTIVIGNAITMAIRIALLREHFNMNVIFLLQLRGELDGSQCKRKY